MRILFIQLVAAYELKWVTLTEQKLKDRKKEGSLRFYKPKFSYIFCDMDGESAPANLWFFLHFP